MRRLHITKHAKERMAQRLNGTNLRVLAEHVHQNCIRREEIPPGPLRMFLDCAWAMNEEPAVLKLHQATVYVFKQVDDDTDALITVYRLPRPLRRLSHEVEAEFWRAKRERRSG